MAGDAAPTRLRIAVGGRMDRMTIGISAQEFGARAYIRTRFRYSTNDSFWAGFTYDTYCEAPCSASDIIFCVAGQIEQSGKRTFGTGWNGVESVNSLAITIGSVTVQQVRILQITVRGIGAGGVAPRDRAIPAKISQRSIAGKAGCSRIKHLHRPPIGV